MSEIPPERIFSDNAVEESGVTAPLPEGPQPTFAQRMEGDAVMALAIEFAIAWTNASIYGASGPTAEKAEHVLAEAIYALIVQRDEARRAVPPETERAADLSSGITPAVHDASEVGAAAALSGDAAREAIDRALTEWDAVREKYFGDDMSELLATAAAGDLLAALLRRLS